MSVSAIEAIERRRSIRQYDHNYKIPQDILEKIMHTAQQLQLLVIIKVMISL